MAQRADDRRLSGPDRLELLVTELLVTELLVTELRVTELLVTELRVTVLVVLAAVATSWSSYQASRWHGDQSEAASRTSALRFQADHAAGVAEAQTPRPPDLPRPIRLSTRYFRST